MLRKVYWSSCKVPEFLCDFDYTWLLSTEFGKILKYQISWKSVKWKPSCSMRADRQTRRINHRSITIFQSPIQEIQNPRST